MHATARLRGNTVKPLWIFFGTINFTIVARCFSICRALRGARVGKNIRTGKRISLWPFVPAIFSFLFSFFIFTAQHKKIKNKKQYLSSGITEIPFYCYMCAAVAGGTSERAAEQQPARNPICAPAKGKNTIMSGPFESLYANFNSDRSKVNGFTPRGLFSFGQFTFFAIRS